MKKARIIITTLIALMLTLALAACNGTQGTPAKTAEQTTKAPAETVSETGSCISIP